MNILFFFIHKIFNSYYGEMMFEDDLIKKIKLDCLYKNDISFHTQTKIFYPNHEVFNSKFLSLLSYKKSITIILENIAFRNLIYHLCFYSSFYNIENVIIICDSINNSIYRNKHLLHQNFKDMNFFIMNQRDSVYFRSVYNPNIDYNCKISIFQKTEIVFIAVLYILIITLFLSIIKLIRIWNLQRLLKKQQKKLHNDELKKIPNLKYLNINSDLKENDSCLICMDTYMDDDLIRLLACRHFFHSECVDPWLTLHSAKCPKCRYSLVEEV